MDRDRHRPAGPAKHRLLAVLTAALLALPGVTALTSPARAADADVLRNGGFEAGLAAAGDTFVSSVSKIIDTYGLDGLDIDFEGHGLSLDTDGREFKKNFDACFGRGR